MENISELFILFPKYDEDNSNKYCYLNCYKLKSEKDLDSYLEKLRLFLDCINRENYVGYYDLENIESFIKPLTILGEEFYPQSLGHLRSSLKEWEELDVYNTENDSLDLNGLTISNDILCEIAKRANKNKNNSHLLINHEAYDCQSHIDSLYSRINVKISQCAVCQKEAANWFNSNRRPVRVYNHNQKHGENGRGNQIGESKLLCDRVAAEKMLHNASGDYKSTLYYFDNNHGKYIEYKYENTPNNSYHAFHVDDKNRVPKNIKDIINRLNNDTI